MTLTQVTQSTHVSEAQAHLIEQFKAKPGFLAMIKAYVKQVSDLENAAFEVLLETTLATAVGVQLDGIGQIVGEERFGRSDADYRIAISVRILINLNDSTIENILEIFDTVEPTVSAELIEYPPAALMLTMATAITVDPAGLANLLRIIRAGGVDGILVYSLTNNPFLFAPDTAQLFDTTNSFGSANLALNGDFGQWTADDPDDWTESESGTGEVTERGFDQGNAGSGSGSCNFFKPAAPDISQISKDISVTVGRVYQLKIDCGFFSAGNMRVDDFGIGVHFDFNITAVGETVLTFTATNPLVRLRIQVDATGSDVTIDNVLFIDVDGVSLTPNVEMSRWTADDPDGWTVTETPATSIVSEVAPNQDVNGQDQGACNFYSDGGTGVQFVAGIDLSAVPAVLDSQYVLRFKISKFTKGTLYYKVESTNGVMVDDQVTLSDGADVYQVEFTANKTDFDISFFGTDDLVTFVVAQHDFTIDWLEVVELNTDTVGLFASATRG